MNFKGMSLPGSIPFLKNRQTMSGAKSRSIQKAGAKCLWAAALLLTGSAKAETPDTALVHHVAAKYSRENAVYLNVNRHLIITCNDGKLAARTEERLEKLFLTELGAQTYGMEDLSFTYMNDLETMPTATAWIPGPKGYNRVRCTTFGEFHPADEAVFYDDDKGIAAMYSGLGANSVTETRYTLVSADPGMLPTQYFYQSNLPIAHATIEVTVPSFVNIGYKLVGEQTDKIKMTTEEKNNTITYRFTFNDVAPLVAPAGVPSPRYFLPHLVTYIKSYTLPGDHRVKHLMEGPSGLYKYMYKYVRNMNVAHDKDLDATVAKITKNDVTPRQKAAHIYDWVQANLHYVAFEDSLGGFYPRQAGTINGRKFGDCKDMTSILVAMLRKAGVKAYFTWIGTVHMPYSIEETPVPLFNHMICAINVDNDWIFMDGTHPTIPFGKYPDGDQGKDALIAIDEDNFKVMKVPVSEPAANTTNDSTVVRVISGKSISGTVNAHYSGSTAYTLGVVKQLTKNEQRARVMRMITGRGSDKYLIDKYELEIEPSGNRDARIHADYNIHDYIQKVKGQYAINMNMKRDFAEDWINTKNRTVAYYFKNKEKIKETVILEIPKGSGVAHLPAPAHGNLNNILSYSIRYRAAGGKVILEKEFELKARSVGRGDFAAFNKLIEGLQKQYKESVVLSAH
jgi:transglutaminase-like putative cysteine protease